MPPNPWRYAGGALDATGLYHFGARYYDPAIGRWTQQDSVVSLGDPANANRYAYAGDDPVNSVDPGGIKKKKAADYISGCGAGATAGLALGALSGEDFTVVGAFIAAGEGCAFVLVTTKASETLATK
jgi:RHS repeat-associated protein